MTRIPRINNFPCTEQEEQQNLSLIKEILDPILVSMETTNNNTFLANLTRFELTSVFTARVATAIILDASDADAGLDPIEVVDVMDRYATAMGTEKGYATLEDEVYEVVVLGGAGTGSVDPDDVFNNITIIGGSYDDTTNTLTITAGGTDSFTVLVTGTDSTPKYLHDAFNDHTTYDGDEDLIVKTETQGAGGANQSEQLFVDMSFVRGWNDIQYQLLGQEVGETKLQTMEVWLTRLDGYDSGIQQSVIHDSGDSPNWKKTTKLVKITGTITGRSGTTLGNGTVQEVDPENLASNLGTTFTAYNTSPRSLSGADETVYCRAVLIGVRYFIDTLDPIWYRTYDGWAADKIFYTNSTDSSGLRFGAEECA